MGQRSQIYVAVEDDDGVNHLLTARYFQWNYGEYMISRTRQVIEAIQQENKYGNNAFCYKVYQQREINPDFQASMQVAIDVDFDTRNMTNHSQDFLKPSKNWYESFEEDKPIFNSRDIREMFFDDIDNDDGQLLIKVSKDGNISYALTIPGEYLPLNAEEYLNWDCRKSEWQKHFQNEKYYTKEEGEAIIAYTSKNIDFINKEARLMSKEEIQDFLNYKYPEMIYDLAVDNELTNFVADVKNELSESSSLECKINLNEVPSENCIKATIEIIPYDETAEMEFNISEPTIEAFAKGYSEALSNFAPKTNEVYEFTNLLNECLSRAGCPMVDIQNAMESSMEL